MRFVETPIFTKVITALLDDESYRGLQSALMRRPSRGRPSAALMAPERCDGRGQVPGSAAGFE